jgi:ABC-type glycerol-3-phosphate transport system substrate-binding protein
MRTLIIGIFGGLAALTMLAMVLKPKPPSKEQTVIVWSSGANPYRTEQIEIFNRLHPDILLKQDSNNTRFEKVIVQVSSGVGPDLYDVHRGSFMQAYAEAGVAWDITNLASSYGIAADIDTWPSVHNQITIDDRQYGYPAVVGPDLILYNKNIFERLGEPYPQGLLTWEEYFAMLRRIDDAASTQGEKIWGTAATNRLMGGPTPFLWLHIFYSLKGEYFSDDGTQLTIDTPAMRIAFQMHRDALFKHKIMPTSLEFGTLSGQGGWGGSITYFAEGKFATIVGQKSMLGTAATFVEQQKRQLEAWSSDPEKQRTEPKPEVLRLGVVAIPHFAGHPPAYQVMNMSVAINPNSPNRKAALTFLQFLASADYAHSNLELWGMSGNPKHIRYDHPFTHPELAEREMTKLMAEMMPLAYSIRQSPFLLTMDISRVLYRQVIRMESDPTIEPVNLVMEAQQELEKLMASNLKRDPKLAALHMARSKSK